MIVSKTIHESREDLYNTLYTTKEPEYGSCYLLDDGTFVFPFTKDEKTSLAFHGDEEDIIYNKHGQFKGYDLNHELQHEYNAILLNSRNPECRMNFRGKPTSAQYNALLNWLDFVVAEGNDKVDFEDFGTEQTSGKFATMSLKNKTSEEIIDSIKRYFISGVLTESAHLVDEENKNVFYTKEVYDLKNYIVNNVSKDVIKICDYVSQGLYVFCNAYNGIHEMLEEMAQEQGLVDSSNDVRYVAYTGTTEDDDYETIDYSDGIVYDYGDFKIFEVTLAMGKSKFIGSRLQRALGQFKSKYRLVNGSFRRIESLNEFFDRLDTYAGADVYATDSAYQLKNTIEKSEIPLRIYFWKDTYYFCSAVGDMTHDGMMQFTSDYGYSDWNDNSFKYKDYMVFLPNNEVDFYDTTLGEDDYFDCRVYPFGVMYVRDKNAYSNSLFKALGEPLREIHYNEFRDRVKISTKDKVYDFDADSIGGPWCALDMQLENLNDDESLKEDVNKYYRLELEDCWRNRLGLFTGAFETIPSKETIENYPEDFEDLTPEERERYYRFDELLDKLSQIKSPGVDAEFQNFKEDDIFAFTSSKYNEILPIIKEMRQLLKEMGFKLIIKELDIDDANISYRDDDQVAFSKSNSSKYVNESKQDIEKFRQWAGDELANRFFKLKDRLPDRAKDIYYWMGNEKQLLNLKDRYKNAQEHSNTSNYEKWAHENAIDSLKTALDNVEQTPTRREVNKLGKAGSEKIYEDDNWLVLKINTYEASVKYGKGTEWCITGNNSDQGRMDFNHHTLDSGATIYFFINKKNKLHKYALEYVNDKNWCLFDETDFPHVGYGTSFERGVNSMGGEHWYKGDARDTFPVIKGLPDINKAYDDFERLNESLLLEKNRQDLLNKSRASDNYSSKDRQGENRYTRRLKSQIANSVRDYNRIDMDAFWKGDILDFDVRVHGETDDYVVSLDFSNILRRLQQEVSANKNRLEFKCVLRALVGAFNSDSDLLVSCTCPDWKYRQAYWATRGGYNSGQPQPSNGMAIANPNDTKGGGCKHVNLVLSNLDWMMKIASVINNYIKWTRDNMGRNYADYIFPKVYGMPYKKAVQLSLLDKEDKFGDAILPSDIDTINQAIERGMIGKDDQGKFVKGNEYRFQKTTKPQPEDNPDQMKLDLDNEEEDKEVNKSVADIEKEKNVRFTKDEPQESEEDEEANIRFEK